MIFNLPKISQMSSKTCSEATSKEWWRLRQTIISVTKDPNVRTGGKITNYCNVTKKKQVNSSHGSIMVDVPQDRESSFGPRIVKKLLKDISSIDQNIISIYTKGITTREISETLMYIYWFKVSEGFVPDMWWINPASDWGVAGSSAVRLFRIKMHVS